MMPLTHLLLPLLATTGDGEVLIGGGIEEEQAGEFDLLGNVIRGFLKLVHGAKETMRRSLKRSKFG